MTHRMLELLELKLYAKNMERNLDLLSSNFFAALKIECFATCAQGFMIHHPNLAKNMLKYQLWKNLVQTILKKFPHLVL